MTDLPIVIDSWCWIEYFKGTTSANDAAKYIEGDMLAFVSTINLSEIYRWFLLSYSDAEANSAIQDVKDRCFIVPVDEQIAIIAAKIKHELKWGLGDSIILATARTRNAVVITGDPDFKNVPNTIIIGQSE